MIKIKHCSFVTEYVDSLGVYYVIHGIYKSTSTETFRIEVTSDAHVVGSRGTFIYRRKRKNKFKFVKSLPINIGIDCKNS